MEFEMELQNFDSLEFSLVSSRGVLSEFCCIIVYAYEKLINNYTQICKLSTHAC